METKKQELRRMRLTALVIAGVAVAFSIFMWSVTPPKMLGTNIGCSIAMAFPVAGALWVARITHRELDQLDTYSEKG